MKCARSDCKKYAFCICSYKHEETTKQIVIDHGDEPGFMLTPYSPLMTSNDKPDHSNCLSYSPVGSVDLG